MRCYGDMLVVHHLVRCQDDSLLLSEKHWAAQFGLFHPSVRIWITTPWAMKCCLCWRCEVIVRWMEAGSIHSWPTATLFHAISPVRLFRKSSGTFCKGLSLLPIVFPYTCLEPAVSYSLEVSKVWGWVHFASASLCRYPMNHCALFSPSGAGFCTESLSCLCTMRSQRGNVHVAMRDPSACSSLGWWYSLGGQVLGNHPNRNPFLEWLVYRYSNN